MDIAGKNVLVFGSGISGIGAAGLLEERGASVTLYDGNDKLDAEEIRGKMKDGAKTDIVLGEFPEELLGKLDLVIISPGVPTDLPIVNRMREADIPVVGEIELAYELGKGEVLAITGTNGKTTTTTLTYEILHAYYKDRVHLAGNIGYPLCGILNDIKENDILVMEISCQQSVNLFEFHPHIALMTNLSVAHVDFLKSYENYKRVKLKLFKNQTANDIAILNIENDEVMEGTKDIIATTKYFSSKREINGAYYKGNALWYYGEKILDRDKFLLAGNHNVENALGAMMIAKEVGVDNESIVKVLTTFKGVAHRLEFVDEIDGVKYYNDTEATNTKCTQIALNSFNCDIVLILGGLERGQNFHDLDKYMGNVKEIVGIGQCRNRVKEYGDDLNINTQIFETLDEAMDYINEIKQSGEVVLLSPASASWDQYKQCEDRGDEFKEKIRKMRENS